MPQFWNERYAQEEYIYGEEPNEYLKEKLEGLPTGNILFPAEGEGRNGVYTATLGWKVSAFDASSEGKRKAELLASKKGVNLNYTVSDADTIDYEANSFDALVLIYTHFSNENRRKLHQKLASFLKPNGILILEGFSKDHVKNQEANPSAGGPRNVAMLYDLNELKEDFKDFEFIEAIKAETELKEGRHHLGKASVIRIFAKKK